MSYFFQKNRQRIAQWNPVRRPAPWGRGPIPQIVLHTFEWPANRSMLSAATYLLNRTTHGSYHSLAGGTSEREVLRLAPVTAETWHCVPSNNWASGVSATTYAANWNKLSSTQRRNFVHSMAYASYLLSQELIAIGKAPVPAKRISRAQAMRGVWGFTYHRTMDPGRRTDPAHPEHNFPWDMFLTEYNRLMKGGSPAPAKPAVPKGHLDMHPDELNKHLSRHAENVHAGVQRDIKRLVVPLLENLAGAIAAVGAGETFDEAKLLAGVQASAESGAREGALQAEEALRQALVETLAEQPDRDDEAVANAVVSKIAARLTEGE